MTERNGTTIYYYHCKFEGDTAIFSYKWARKKIFVDIIILKRNYAEWNTMKWDGSGWNGTERAFFLVTCHVYTSCALFNELRA